MIELPNSALCAQLAYKGRYRVEQVRNGLIIAVREGFNAVVTEGKNKNLNVFFRGTTSFTTWYLGLLNTAPSLDVGDTYAVHAGWTEFTDYTFGGNAYRAVWAPAAASGGAVSNAAPIVFDITASVSTPVAGVCCVGNIAASTAPGNTAGGGTLWGTMEFASDIPVITGDQLKITYGVSA